MNNYIDMYNYSFELTYREIDGDAGDTKYREEFLNVFGLKKWEGEQVEKSFETFKNLNFVDKKGNKLNISEQVRQILGSYSYLTHYEISKHTGWSIDQINQLQL